MGWLSLIIDKDFIYFLNYVILPALLYVYVISYISTFIHELGHLIACLLLKLKVTEFQIGTTRPYIRFSLFNIKFSFNLLADGGFIKIPEGDYSKYIAILTLLAGPMANIFLIIFGEVFNYQILSLYNLLLLLCMLIGRGKEGDINRVFIILGIRKEESIKQ